MIDRPGHRLETPETTAHDRQQAIDPEMVEQPPLRLDHVARPSRRENRHRRVGRSSGRVKLGPVVPRQPPSTFEQTTKKRFVSIAFPGPTSRSHHPGSSLRVVAGDVRVAAQGVADEDRVVALRVELAPGLVADPDTGKRARRSRASASRSTRSRARARAGAPAAPRPSSPQRSRTATDPALEPHHAPLQALARSA